MLGCVVPRELKSLGAASSVSPSGPTLLRLPRLIGPCTRWSATGRRFSARPSLPFARCLPRGPRRTLPVWHPTFQNMRDGSRYRPEHEKACMKLREAYGLGTRPRRVRTGWLGRTGPSVYGCSLDRRKSVITPGNARAFFRTQSPRSRGCSSRANRARFGSGRTAGNAGTDMAPPRELETPPNGRRRYVPARSLTELPAGSAHLRYCGNFHPSADGSSALAPHPKSLDRHPCDSRGHREG